MCQNIMSVGTESGGGGEGTCFITTIAQPSLPENVSSGIVEIVLYLRESEIINNNNNNIYNNNNNNNNNSNSNYNNNNNNNNNNNDNDNNR